MCLSGSVSDARHASSESHADAGVPLPRRPRRVTHSTGRVPTGTYMSEGFTKETSNMIESTVRLIGKLVQDRQGCPNQRISPFADVVQMRQSSDLAKCLTTTALGAARRNKVTHSACTSVYLRNSSGRRCLEIRSGPTAGGLLTVSSHFSRFFACW